MVLALSLQATEKPLEDRLLGYMTRNAQAYLRDAAKGFRIEGNLRPQAGLFREDLVWQSRGFNDRQLDAMVYVVVALSMERAVECSKPEDGRSTSPEDLLRFVKMRNYAEEAAKMLDGLRPKVENVKPSEMRFYF